jgi:hypothetical protein
MIEIRRREWEAVIRNPAYSAVAETVALDLESMTDAKRPVAKPAITEDDLLSSLGWRVRVTQDELSLERLRKRRQLGEKP